MTQSRASTGKSQQNLRTIDEELVHQMKKSNLLGSMNIPLHPYFFSIDIDRKAFYYSADETRKKNDEIIKQLKKENKDLKKLRDDLLANKRVYFF